MPFGLVKTIISLICHTKENCRFLISSIYTGNIYINIYINIYTGDTAVSPDCWMNSRFARISFTVKKTFCFRGLGRLEYQGHTSETDAGI